MMGDDMKAFKGWVIAALIKGRYYQQIETLRPTRREAIAKGVELYVLRRQPHKWLSIALESTIKETWAEMRREGHKAVKAKLEAEER